MKLKNVLILLSAFGILWVASSVVEFVSGVFSAPTATTPAPSATAPTPAPAPSCTQSGGRLYANVVLYSDSACQEFLGIVYGGGPLRDGGKGVVIDYPDGSRDWKLRSAVAEQAYVMTNDPAIEAGLWRDLKQ